MTRDELVDLTRRLINERTASRWTDDVVRRKVNFAWHEAQGRIRDAGRRDLFTRRVRMNVTAGTDRYAWPTREQVNGFRFKDSTTGLYKDMEERALPQLYQVWADDASRNFTRSVRVWARDGGEVVIAPTPTENVTLGLEAWIFYPVALSAADDVPQMPEELHHKLAYRAARHCIKESKHVGAEALADLDAEFFDVFGLDDRARANLARIMRRSGPATMTYDVPWAGAVRAGRHGARA